MFENYFHWNDSKAASFHFVKNLTKYQHWDTRHFSRSKQRDAHCKFTLNFFIYSLDCPVSGLNWENALNSNNICLNGKWSIGENSFSFIPVNNLKEVVMVIWFIISKSSITVIIRIWQIFCCFPFLSFNGNDFLF